MCPMWPTWHAVKNKTKKIRSAKAEKWSSGGSPHVTPGGGSGRSRAPQLHAGSAARVLRHAANAISLTHWYVC